MKTMRKEVASLVAIMALALIAATTVAAANPHQTYTCVKVMENGQSEVQVDVPEPAVAGLTNAGFTCVADETDEEGPGNEDPGNEDPGDENEGSEPVLTPSAAADFHVPQGQRSIYCSTTGPAFRANGDGMGIALNLLDEQGALMVEMGLVTPAIFYQGIGASCDVLPGFENSGIWVGHVGDVVPGVAVYPLFVPATN
jgi:Flp pilus assembly pilin Flp